MPTSCVKDPNVLLVYKKSSFIADGKDVPPALRKKRFYGNHLSHYASLEAVEAVLRKYGVRYKKRCRADGIDHRPFDLVISVGGDGTFLQCARQLTRRQIILGVNSDPVWSVGQFCATDSRGFEALFLKVLAGRHRVRRLFKMRLILDGPKPKVFFALNDVLVAHMNPAAMSRYALKVGSLVEEQRSSGIWFATAAGSTGAVLSAGGSRMPLESRCVQYKPRELYQARAVYQLTGRVMAVGMKAEVISHMTRGAIFVDGAHVCLPFSYGRKLKVSSSQEWVPVVYA